MKKNLANVLLLLILALGDLGCSPKSAQAAVPTPILYATPVANPTLTPTPFQPEDDTAIYGDPLAAAAGSTPIPTTDIQSQAAATLPTADPNSSLPAATIPSAIYSPDYAPAQAPSLTGTDMVTFALLGSDTRSGNSFRTDTIVIAVIRPHTGQVTLISIPRDLWVYIPEVGMQRINTAYEFGNIYNYPGGGPGLLKDTILYNLGIRVDHTALVDFEGFRRIVNTLGGVDVPVACPYTDWRLINPDVDPNLESNWSLYTAGPGLIHMDGDMALWYARSRKKSSDFDRGRRSQEVLRALFTRGLQVNAVAKIPELYGDLNDTVSTDLTLGDILSMAPLALHIKNADIRSYYIGRDYVTSWTTPTGAAVLLPNYPAIQAMLQKALSPTQQPVEEIEVQVAVQNGTANPGWDALAAERLNYAGYGTQIANADNSQQQTTLLYDVSKEQDPAKAAALLAVLGLQPSALVSNPQDSPVSYVLVVGADYQPCFNPSNMAP